MKIPPLTPSALNNIQHSMTQLNMEQLEILRKLVDNRIWRIRFHQFVHSIATTTLATPSTHPPDNLPYTPTPPCT
ncbi:hypothetical protein SAMN05421788_110168 [Filimonas lacunae]|uniref:Uncharacterized protein n=1 Tax=Filimonas lacunae TaxID=477680 RepID=A0A1N7R8J3_9BACT|nr:hypothetical protein [Filimonas lacunae]SIT31431.1 hypothetical protein SAMN05421788_110168 [Filimonas lacunae]